MDSLHVWHLVLLSMWAGIVVTESVVEMVGRHDHHVAAAAHMHYWIDMLLELPVIGGILLTGVLLAVRAWPLTSLHWVKIVAGLIAITSNLLCAVVVTKRRRHHQDVAAMKSYQLRIHLSLVGAPFAAVAAYIGFRYFMP